MIFWLNYFDSFHIWSLHSQRWKGATQQHECSYIFFSVLPHFLQEFTGFVLERIIEHVTNVGVVFLPRGQKYEPCLRQYVINEQASIINNVSDVIKRAQYKQVEKVSIYFYQEGLLINFSSMG